MSRPGVVTRPWWPAAGRSDAVGHRCRSGSRWSKWRSFARRSVAIHRPVAGCGECGPGGHSAVRAAATGCPMGQTYRTFAGTADQADRRPSPRHHRPAAAGPTQHRKRRCPSPHPVRARQTPLRSPSWPRQRGLYRTRSGLIIPAPCGASVLGSICNVPRDRGDPACVHASDREPVARFGEHRRAHAGQYLGQSAAAG